MSLSSFSCIFSRDQHSGATVCIHRYCIMHRLLISWPSSGGSSQKWTLPRCLPIATSSIHLPIHSATVEMWRQAPPALKHWLQNQKWPPTETVWSTIMQILGSADGPRQSCNRPAGGEPVHVTDSYVTFHSAAAAAVWSVSRLFVVSCHGIKTVIGLRT